MAVNILRSGVFPFFLTTSKNTSSQDSDPVPHALVLTGIVVAVSAAAVGIGRLRLYRSIGKPLYQ